MSSEAEQKKPILQRLIAGSLTGMFVVWSVHWLYLEPVSQIIHSREEISDLQANLESLFQKISGRSNIQEYVDSARMRLEETDAILRDPTYSLAVSSLQVLVSDLAKRHGLVVRRMQGLPRSTGNNDRVEVRLRLQAVAKNANIAQFLSAVASEELLMSVDHLDLSVRRAMRAAEGRSYIEDIYVDVTLELSALWRGQRDL